MKVGFYVTGSLNSSHDDLTKQVLYSEEVGFDSIWLRERHFHPDHEGRNFFSSPFIAASYFASLTKNIRIGIGARLLPLDHPIHVAEGAATLDVISNGRLDLGIARIGENELYQNAFGIQNDEIRKRFEQSFKIIMSALTETKFSSNGDFYNIPEVSIHPKPIQKPHPPIYLVGISSETLKFGANYGLPLLIAGAQTISMVEETLSKYNQMLEENGYEKVDIVHPVNRFIYVSDTNQQAIEDTKETIMGFINRKDSAIRDFLFLPKDKITYELLYNEVCIVGEPDYCLSRIEELRDNIDLRYMILTFNYFTLEHSKCLKSMELFSKYVLPELKT